MAWFSGRVSLGNFPDLAGAVNKLQESVKNIEKNFDSALGLEEKSEKSESSNEGLWASATDRKALFDPVMALMGQKSEESACESSAMQESSKHLPTVEKSSGDPGSPQHKSKVEEKEGTEPETDRSLHSAAEKATAENENEVRKADKDAEHPETAGETNNVILYPDKAESELTLMPVIQPEPIGQDVETLESVGKLQEKEISEVGHTENSELVQAKSGVIEVDEVESSMIVPHKLHNVVDMSESMDEQKTQVENTDKQKSQAEELSETIGLVQTEASSNSHAGGGTKPSGLHSASTEETDSTDESSNYPLPTALPSDEASAMVSDLVSPENHAIDKAVEVDQQVNDNETDIKEQQLSPGLNVSDSSDSMLELEKVKREMKMMETALQGAARQAQAKADEIAKLMNENEHLKAVIEDLKRKSNDAEIESLREEYHQRVATIERKVYALTKERDTLRREQSKKSDAAALLKEKDEIINQVMAEGEELSKKQAAQESQIRKLRAQIRELEEEKKGLNTKLQVEENKVESMKKDKAATEKLLQETIEKHQIELTSQKEYYVNALNAAKEAEALAETRVNNEARTELESRFREAEERESMLVQALEELRQTLSRKEQQAVFREDMFRRDFEDLQKRYQASERRCEELITQVPESTRPLLRQIEAMQETTARRAEAWAAVERSLNSRLQEAEAKAAAAEDRERSVNERLSQTLSRINVLEAQISCLRAEQTQLNRSLEKERQRAAENRQEYLAAKEEADTQEGRANQLEEEIKELRRKHKQELQDALMHRELLQQEIEKEKAARLDMERTVHSVAASDQTLKTQHTSAFENGNLTRKLSSASSVGSMEESYFLQASLDSSEGFSERRNAGEATISPYYMKSMTPSAFEAALRQKEGELASYMSRLASLESIRDSLAEELVKMTAQCEKLRAEASVLPGIRAELDALRRRHAAALELMGERDEELEELRADIVDLKEMYREQVNLLVNKIQVMGTA
ncbi:golgin candidate 5 isoform X2 [Alnus glutinosa]|uniref:golgin candidate 5 isoform X2 n=1 Tax=Alnus glutinosa TaxID=3517 RepID=UPI002D793641|nr:golgin candidate 5 isoform X2 [Alnus glutinosa]